MVSFADDVKLREQSIHQRAAVQRGFSMLKKWYDRGTSWNSVKINAKPGPWVGVTLTKQCRLEMTIRETVKDLHLVGQRV